MRKHIADDQTHDSSIGEVVAAPALAPRAGASKAKGGGSNSQVLNYLASENPAKDREALVAERDALVEKLRAVCGDLARLDHVIAISEALQ